MTAAALSDLEKCEASALNRFRSGLVDTGLAIMGLMAPRRLTDFYEVPKYAADSSGFKDAMRKLAQMLREKDL